MPVLRASERILHWALLVQRVNIRGLCPPIPPSADYCRIGEPPDKYAPIVIRTVIAIGAFSMDKRDPTGRLEALKPKQGIRRTGTKARLSQGSKKSHRPNNLYMQLRITRKV